MKIQVRILPGQLANYVQRGGSWDEANPDPASFLVDTFSIPPIGGCILFNHPTEEGNPLTIAEVTNVVTTEATPYVFVSTIQKV